MNEDKLSLLGSRSVSRLRELLREIMEPDEYCSHSGALFLHCLSDLPPPVFTVVSSRRRRPRNIDGWNIRFVLHRRQPQNMKQAIHLCNGIPAATVEMAFVDLLSDLNDAPSIGELLDLAVSLPLSLSTCLQLAQGVSDTVFKRAAFLLAFYGRLPSRRVPFQAFRSSPVVLDPRCSEDSAKIWDCRFRLYYPENLLGRPPAGRAECDRNVFEEWLRIRCAPDFLEAQQRSGCLVLRNDPEIKNISFCWNGFPVIENGGQLLHWAQHNGLDQIATSVDQRQRERVYRLLCAIMPVDVLSGIKALVKNGRFVAGLSARALDLLLQLALLFKQHKSAQRIIVKHGEKLLDMTGLTGLLVAADAMLGNGQRCEPKPGSLLIRALVIRGDYVRAQKCLPSIIVPEKSDPGWAWYALAFGMLKHRTNREKIAKAMLNSARRAMSELPEDYGLARVEVALGNLYLGQARITRARRHYRSALRLLAEKRKSYPVLYAGIMSNMGVTLYHLGQREKADAILQKAAAIIRDHEQPSILRRALHVRSVIAVIQGLLYRAIDLATRCYKVCRSAHDSGGMVDAAAILSFTYALVCEKDMAHFWLEAIPVTTEAARLTRAMVQARNLLVEGNLAEAESILVKTQAAAAEHGMGRLFQARLAILSIIALRARNNDAEWSGRELVEEVVRHDPCLDEANWFRLVMALYDPLGQDWHDLDRILCDSVSQARFDPLWFLLAPDLLRIPLASAAKYLELQGRVTPGRLQGLILKYLMKHGAESAVRFLRLPRKDGVAFLIHEPQKQSALFEGSDCCEQSDQEHHLVEFDFLQGRINCLHGSVSFKPRSLIGRLLKLLLFNFDEYILLEHIYCCVWQTGYEDESDLARVKTAVSRLRGMLENACPSINIVLTVNKRFASGVKLNLPGKWRVKLPEP